MKQNYKKFTDFQCQLIPEENLLYLHHGPIDIIVHVDGPEEIRSDLFECAKNDSVPFLKNWFQNWVY